METYLLKENVLTDDILLIADEGKVFKGGYIAIVECHTFANEWSDKKHIIKFRNENRLNSFLKKNYPEFEY